jgi:endonuclease/exonuclease/phosphatase (EEP) superfamily protein YafD
VRKWLRVAFWVVLVTAPIALSVEDFVSRRGLPPKAGLRLVTVNVDTRPGQVAAGLKSLDPDIVFMQETASPCRGAGEVLGLQSQDGSDQCVLSRWQLEMQPLTWPGPWQPPQLATMEHPQAGRVALVNVRLAIPEIVAALATLGHQWYVERERRNQYPVLQRLLDHASPAIVCGDFNALPLEVDFGGELRDAWSGVRYGATFPARLPAARIDQCWVSGSVVVEGSWTYAVPSDHRALVVDLGVRGVRGTGR